MKLNVRIANIDDLTCLYNCAVQFYNEKLKSKKMTFNDESARQFIKLMLTSGLVLILEKDEKLCGAIGGILTPWVLDGDLRVMTEMFWYVSIEYRGIGGLRLLEKFEDESRKIGAQRVLMTGLEDADSSICKLYERLGYIHLEHHYIKEL